MRRVKFVSVAVLYVSASCLCAADDPAVSFRVAADTVEIQIGDIAVASYVFEDPEILRPYFAHVKTIDGQQVTRNHPPRKSDRKDHATMHPGIWLAFGDVNGHDFWRNKARVEHVEFVQKPSAEKNVGSFVERKRYVASDGEVVCEEEFRFAIRAAKESYVLYLESQFSHDQEFYFGDQEEMGLGVRVTTSISQIEGGRLRDSHGRKGAKKIWSQSAEWCDYSGLVNGRAAGIAVLTHPANFRTSWWHARNYGLLAANAFGRAAMQKGKPDRTVVKPGESFRLRYAAWVHGDVDKSQISDRYQAYSALR